MLWYKAWLETRMVFLICLVGVTFLAWFPVYSDSHHEMRSAPTLDFYYSIGHGGHQFLGGTWLVAIVFLTMGGLLREQVVGAASFTLALPFARVRLTGVRAAVGLIQAMILIVIPSAAICIEESLLGRPYPISQAWFHIVLLASGGLVYFAAALLIASLVRSEYVAPLISLCVVVGTAIVLRDPPARTYSPFHFMAGAAYFDKESGLLLGPIPWVTAGIWMALGVILLAASVKAIQVREF